MFLNSKHFLEKIYKQETLVLVLLVPLYILGYYIATITHRLPTDISPVWPPTGLILAAVLIYERKALLPAVAGVLLGHFLIYDIPFSFIPISVLANAGAPWAALYVKNWILKDTDPFEESMGGLYKLLALGLFVSFTGGLIGVSGLCFINALPWSNFPRSLFIWTLGNFMGVLVCAPAFLHLFLLLRKKLRIHQKINHLLTREQAFWILMIVLSFLSISLFSEDNSPQLDTLGFLIMGMLIWSAIRFPPIFTEITVMIIVLTLWTFIGLGAPGFPQPSNDAQITTLLLFTGVSAFFPVLIAITIQQSRYLQTRLKHQANHDSLTGLLNRRGFEQHVIEFLETEEGPLSAGMIFLNMDHIKVVNDSCGHLAGDHLLDQIAFLLQSEFKREAFVGRFGGDTFSVFSFHIDETKLSTSCDKIRQQIQDYRFFWEGEAFALSASLGAVHITTPRSISVLLSKADMACHLAKEKGGNTLVLLNAEDHTLDTKKGHWSLFGRIGYALDHNEFSLFAQPIIPLHPGETGRHYEILLRMRSKTGELILPDLFIPIAEQNHIMRSIDYWVTDHVIEFLEAHPSLVKRDNLFSVNLSGQSINSPNFQDDLIKRLAHSKIPGSILCFEITESATIQNLKMAKRFLNQIKAYDCKFALDDFGKGFSSFSYIKHLPVDFIKIDGSFIRDSFDSEVDQAMIRAISDIAKSLGLQTIAEYVCSHELNELMSYLRIDYAQGTFHGEAELLENILDTESDTP